MKNLLLVLLFIFVTFALYAQVEVIELPELSKKNCLISKSVLSSSSVKIKRYALLYKTKGKNGEEVTASGLVAFQDNVVPSPTTVFYSHATPKFKTDVPSHSSFESKFMTCRSASDKTVIIAPDYIGLGYGKGDHPYMVTDLTVSASLDLYDVAKKWLETQNIELNNTAVMGGYSQGGHATLAIHKYLDQTNSSLKVLKNFSMSAPISLSGHMINSLLYGEPDKNTSFFTAITLANFQAHFGGIYEGPLFNEQFEEAEELGLKIEKKALNNLLPLNPREAVRPEIFAAIESDNNHPLRVHLKENDIVAWEASAPIVVTYSKVDTTIPPMNAKEFFYKMKLLKNDMTLVQSSDSLPHTINYLPSMIYFSNQLREMGL